MIFQTLLVNPSGPLGIRLRLHRLKSTVLILVTMSLVLRTVRGWTYHRLPAKNVAHFQHQFYVSMFHTIKAPRMICAKTQQHQQFRAVPLSYNSRRQLSIFMSAGDEDEIEKDGSKELTSTWNVPGLKKEVQRIILRCHKKIGKASERVTKAKQTAEKLLESNTSLEELESCPDVELLELELKELQSRLKDLNTLEEQLQGIKKKSTVLPEDTAALALDLGVDDKPPARPQRGPPKPKGPSGGSSQSRKPYRCYYSFNNIEIRVGKRAEDNDDLTLNPEHRDNADWWMHASGCPGSHVVIRCTDQTVPEEVVMDAASLAARQSKCNGSVIKVSLTRCRDIKKPPGAKAGLVMLTGNVRTVTVDMKQAERRLQRLDESVVIN